MGLVGALPVLGFNMQFQMYTWVLNIATMRRLRRFDDGMMTTAEEISLLCQALESLSSSRLVKSPTHLQQSQACQLRTRMQAKPL